MTEYFKLSRLAYPKYLKWHIVGPPWPGHKPPSQRAWCGRKFDRRWALLADKPNDGAELCKKCSRIVFEQECKL